MSFREKTFTQEEKGKVIIGVNIVEDSDLIFPSDTPEVQHDYENLRVLRKEGRLLY